MGYTKVIQSGSMIEVYKYEKNLPLRRNTRNRASYKKGIKRMARRTESSVRRARVNFRRIVRANLVGATPPALLTLTMFEKLPYATSSRIFSRFIDRIRIRHGKGIKYIAVPEYQKRGAVHWHVLIWGLDHEKATQERQTHYFQRIWLRGFCDCVVTDGHPKLAGYLSKYMSKSMQDVRLSGKRAYYASGNILRPMSAGSHALSEYLDEIIPVDNSPLHVRSFDTQWLGRCDYQQYSVERHEPDLNSSHSA